MVHSNRRRFLQGAGAVATIGVAGCVGGVGDGGPDVTIQLPEGTIQYPVYEAAAQNGLFEEEGASVEVEFVPFDAQVQAVTSGEIDTTMTSMTPYMNNQLRGEDLVTYGWDGCLQLVNALYVRADSEYETIEDLAGDRIGVWSWGSSTVQSFQAVIAHLTGLNLEEDFETTTAPPPALVGLLDDGEIDGVINVSGLTITMESQPDSYRNLGRLNDYWLEESGHTLPLTSWWAYADWYDENEGLAADLLAGAQNAIGYWRDNTRDILEEYGEAAGIGEEAQWDVVEEWTQERQIWKQQADESYVDATWDFVELMDEYGFMDGVPDRDEILRDPR